MTTQRLCAFLIVLFLTAPLRAQADQVSVQLQWLNQFQFAGYYVAKEQGFYRQAALDVTIKEYTPGLNVEDEVVSGRAQFGTGKSSLLLQRLHGVPIVILGAVFQQAPEILVSTRADIRTPADLAGKRIMMTQDQAKATGLLSMLVSQGVNPEQLQIQPHSSRLQDLIDGQTDAMACYLSNEPYQLEAAGIPFQIFNPVDYGFSFYGDLIYTSEEQLKNHPQHTRAFYAATIQGWQWAFDHIEETADLIHTHYNTQNKSLACLIYEGRVLKKLAYSSTTRLGVLQRSRIEQTLELYRLLGLTNGDSSRLDQGLDPLGFNKTELKIGILAHRNATKTLQRWTPLSTYLNRVLGDFHTTVVPIPYDEVAAAIAHRHIDFIFVNPALYLELQNRYGLSRLATLLNRFGNDTTDQYGSVLFSLKNVPIQLEEKMLHNRKLAAVDPTSLGGWLIALETLQEHDVNLEGMEISFLSSHDAVVQAVQSKKADIGIVRTGILERMAQEGTALLSDFHIIHEQQIEGFPFRVSTVLYPEWSMAKLKHVPVETANQLASALLGISRNLDEKPDIPQEGWTVPIDYSSVHKLLKTFNLPPYEIKQLPLKQIIKQYSAWVYGIITFLSILVLHTIYTNRLNKHLEQEVRRRTRALQEANDNLATLARTDPLTGLNNRRYFMEFAQQYVALAQRNATELQLLSLDLDHFKQVNDHYGHQAGDEILRRFSTTLIPLLRSSDLLARVGGEEFVICLQNTSLQGAEIFADKILESVRAIRHQTASGDEIAITVSIGLASLTGEENLEDLLRRSDQALYQAKQNGRDQCVLAPFA